MDDESLAAVLSEFARTLLTDFPIQAILNHLASRIVELLPIDAAGVTMIRPGQAPRYIAASDDSAFHFEQLQTQLGEGPCLAAYESGEAVSVPDVAVESAFPRFAAAAGAAGLGAVFTFPLRHAEGRIGALDLYRRVPGALGAREMQVAQTLADVTAAYLIIAHARDAARVASDRFRHSSLHDPLTGLANRALLQERLQHASNRAIRSHSAAAVLFVDLDRFKSVNDLHGHHTGNELLIAVAHRLSGLIRPGDTLARPSGDEFVILCEDLSNASDADALAGRVTTAFGDPFLVDGHVHSITASVGIAYAGPGEQISDELVVSADLAMYQAKRAGGDRHHVIDLEQARLARAQDLLEQDLRVALGDDPAPATGLALHYQPIVSLLGTEATGVEALLRWTHPDRGPIPAPAAVEVAERSGLINALGTWVLDRACTDHARWSRCSTISVPDLSVNVSPRQLVSPGFLSEVTRTLTNTGMDPGKLILEITETTVVQDDDRIQAVLEECASRGIRVALDDFGTGYSSLSHIRRLPVHIVKIDRSFTADLAHTPRGLALVQAITDLAHALGCSVIAEGVESAQQDQLLRTAGCEAGQGYFYAHPMPFEAMTSLLVTRQSSS